MILPGLEKRVLVAVERECHNQVLDVHKVLIRDHQPNVRGEFLNTPQYKISETPLIRLLTVCFPVHGHYPANCIDREVVMHPHLCGWCFTGGGHRVPGWRVVFCKAGIEPRKRLLVWPPGV